MKEPLDIYRRFTEAALFAVRCKRLFGIAVRGVRLLSLRWNNCEISKVTARVVPDPKANLPLLAVAQLIDH